MGYGIWVSAGPAPKYLPSSNSCGIDPIYFYNRERPEEVAYIHNNIFMSNKHDIASSGDSRLSMDIRQNTFSQRSGLENINMHSGGSVVCNPTGYMYVNNSLTSVPKIYDVGGSVITIEDNVFYRGRSIDLNYPNTTPVSTTVNGQPYQYFPKAKLECNGNFFSVSAEAHDAAGYDELDWPDPGAPAYCRDGYSIVRITGGVTYHHNFLFKDPLEDHLQFDEGTTSTPTRKNFCNEVPFDQVSETPVSVITSNTDADHQNAVVSTTSPKTITEGETLWFDTRLCLDKNRVVQGLGATDMINQWWFHTKSNDLADEARTDNTNSTQAIPFVFDHVGINNITLMTTDLTTSGLNEIRASDLAHQKITVLPNDGKRYLTFWIKDTYVGRALQPYGNTGHGVDDGADAPPLQSATGFVKYAKIDDHILWEDDVEGDEGWQYVKICLNCGTTDQYISGTLEIGIKTRQHVDANRVRGVTFYVDDVYVGCNRGANIIYNGDFEETKPIAANKIAWHELRNLHAQGWDEFDEQDNPALLPPIKGPTCPDERLSNPVASTSVFNPYTGMMLGAEEVRSGRFSYAGWVKNIEPKHRNSAPYYNSPYYYKGIRQYFNCQLSPSRLSGNFDMYPSPTQTSESVFVNYPNEVGQIKTMEVINAQGLLVYSGKFTGNTYHFTPELKPGVYVVRITDSQTISEKKLVITH